MANEAWLARWQNGRIGFNQSRPHPGLVEHWATLALPPRTRVLVPLCGKSVDMRWLARHGHPVTGVELAYQALEQFTADSAEGVERIQRDGFKGLRQGCIELLCGDFFHFHRGHSDVARAFYDRAALIALPPARRQRYAFHLAQLLPPGAAGLLITLEKPPATQLSGPPYHVTPEEVGALFDGNFERTLLEEFEPAEDERESVWMLVRKGPLEEEVRVQR
ncbi:thiopurine S-methyltransferase [Larsenimonas rhizosphaerae]|uniref:Thiopurine S-methyltransferase n=1 Tax=Larsenimonas rhizosphaerae TaxID=2944682 RepID=A0AA41ZFI9_9GAMM|nr:thiopurine S-methyltransferase [Larsenimonas rhizosphaerae]MCM2131152.1 thiopurine S-methyltransferase [Larsenimonas rhizosphaerae]MCX2523857.1 thiopurine S-methyltransferase [Larsenimonas rhizosphaerae]